MGGRDIATLGCDHLRDPKVSKLHHAALAKQQILWLDVTMQDSPLVGILKAGQCGQGNRARQLRRWAPFAKPICKCSAAHALHHERADTALHIVVHAHDVRMVKRREQTSLRCEPLADEIIRSVGPELLNGNVPVKSNMTRREDNAKGSPPKGAPQLISRQSSRQIGLRGREIRIVPLHRDAIMLSELVSWRGPVGAHHGLGCRRLRSEGSGEPERRLAASWSLTPSIVLPRS